ncbi:MAG: hypothetical protein Q7T50_07180 [Candidatus Magasanikbacteria bacterium]|nr:hypothetical protein [Candidatus Magasanikbacteria bacterium]
MKKPTKITIFTIFTIISLAILIYLFNSDKFLKKLSDIIKGIENEANSP